jgi:hypothetical protein
MSRREGKRAADMARRTWALELYGRHQTEQLSVTITQRT